MIVQESLIRSRMAEIQDNNILKEMKEDNPSRIEFYAKIGRKVWVESLSLMLNFFITYMLYPSILFQKDVKLFDSFQWNIYMINLFFNTGNFLGRSLGRLKTHYSRAFLLSTCFCRLLIIASTFTIAFSSDPLLSHPATVLSNSLLVGLTGGWFSVASSISFHRRLKNKEKEHGGFLITTMINGGIAFGSLVSLAGF